jgi:hypothetical protein
VQADIALRRLSITLRRRRTDVWLLSGLSL